jgi:hypothetical protein
MSLELLFTGLALALIIEGLIPALFPNRWRSYVLKLLSESLQTIRFIGFSIVCIGLSILWFINSFPLD